MLGAGERLSAWRVDEQQHTAVEPGEFLELQLRGARLPDGVVDELVGLFRRAPVDLGTSILADRESNRRMEWDLRNGVIIRKGRAHGLATPISDVLVPLLAAASDGPG